jgi:DNA-binding transcriptional LysR family regulator
LYAAPQYLQKYGTPSSVQDLDQHQCVVFRAKDLARTWTLEGTAGVARVDVRGRIGGDDFTFVRAIVRAGGGIGMLPHVNCAADESSGQLVRVLPEFHARGATLYLLYPSAKNVPARVTAFRDFVSGAFDEWSARGSAP